MKLIKIYQIAEIKIAEIAMWMHKIKEYFTYIWK